MIIAYWHGAPHLVSTATGSLSMTNDQGQMLLLRQLKSMGNCSKRINRTAIKSRGRERARLHTEGVNVHKIQVKWTPTRCKISWVGLTNTTKTKSKPSKVWVPRWRLSKWITRKRTVTGKYRLGRGGSVGTRRKKGVHRGGMGADKFQQESWTRRSPRRNGIGAGPW